MEENIHLNALLVPFWYFKFCLILPLLTKGEAPGNELFPITAFNFRFFTVLAPPPPLLHPCNKILERYPQAHFSLCLALDIAKACASISSKRLYLERRVSYVPMFWPLLRSVSGGDAEAISDRGDRSFLRILSGTFSHRAYAQKQGASGILFFWGIKRERY
ncbi:MAG: hypothetical protein ACTSU8_04750, partial [Alphaproteobacteria bacterium]